MEFEDYEDMFTFEEWSFQHPPSDSNDAKTFDELCEEVLLLSYACEKERNNERDSQSNVRQVSKSHEGTDVERVYAVESVISSDTSLTSHLDLGVDYHSQQDFAASGSQTTNDFILSPEKHESIASSSSGKDISTELVSEDDREAQCLECKRISMNSEKVPIQLAMNSTSSKAEECVLDSNKSSYNSTSEGENTPQNSTDTLKVTSKQNPSKSMIAAREETNVSISVFDSVQPGNSGCNQDISVESKIRSEGQEILSGITASFIQNSHIENERFKDFVNDRGESVDESGKKSQNTILEFQIKVDVNTEINSVSESEDNQCYITVSLADSQNTQLKYSSVTGNVTSNLDSVMATPLSTTNSSQLAEVEKVDHVTDAARNELNDSEESEKQSSSETAFHYSPTAEAVLLYSLSPNREMNEEIANDFDTKSNGDTSNDVTCGSMSEEALSLKNSTLNYREADKEQCPNSNINIDANVNFKKENNLTFDSSSKSNDTDTKTEILFCQRNSLENKLEENDMSMKVSKMKRKSENTAVQETGRVKTKLQLRRTRNETSDEVHGQIFNISKESSRNHPEVRKRRFKSRIPVCRPMLKTYSNKKRSGTLRESTCGMKSPFVSPDKQNTSGNKSTINDSETKNITLSTLDSIGILRARNAVNLKSSKLDCPEPDSKFESVIDIITPPEIMTDYSNMFKPTFSLSTEKESLTKSGETETVLPKRKKKEHETLTNAEQGREKNNITSDKEVIYLRTIDTISLMDDTVTSSTPSTDEKKCCEETSTATIEINTNKQFSKGRLRTVINVKHNCVSPECASTCVIHQSDSSGERRIITTRRQGAARIVPFSRNAGSAFALDPFRSTLDKKCTVGAVHKTKIRFLEKESDLHSYQRNFPDDIDDEIIVSESDEQPGLALQPKTYERKIIRYDYISPKVVNRDPQSRKRAADKLTSEVNETSLQDSLEKKSESINKNTTVPNEEPMSPLLKKPRLESTTEKSFTVDDDSINESFMHSKLDIKKTDSSEMDSQKEKTQNSENLDNVSDKEIETPSMPSILITQEDENPEEGTTQIFHGGKIQCNLTSSNIHPADNFEVKTSSNMSESFCDSSSNNIFNDETVKAICASEKAEISVPSPAKAIESGKSMVAESNKNPRHSPRSSRLGMMRRSCDCGSEFSFSTRKSRMDILKSQARFLKNSPPKNTSHNCKTEGEKKTCNHTPSNSSHPRSNGEGKQNPSTEDSKPRESKQPASVLTQTPSSTESGTRACPVQCGNATNKQVASATRTVRRLRRTSVPLQYPLLTPSQGEASPAPTPGRILRRRVLPPAQPAAPTPPTA